MEGTLSCWITAVAPTTSGRRKALVAGTRDHPEPQLAGGGVILRGQPEIEVARRTAFSSR